MNRSLKPPHSGIDPKLFLTWRDECATPDDVLTGERATAFYKSFSFQSLTLATKVPREG